jgi:rRNA maturation endonuclease Nob1
MTKSPFKLPAFFCWNCGKKIKKGSTNCPFCGVKYKGEERYGGQPIMGAGGVGWSDRTNDPFFRSYAKKYIIVSLIWMIGICIVIIAGLLISGQVKPEGEGMAVLIGVPVIICLFGIIFLLYKYTGRKTIEGIVESKQEKQKTRHTEDDTIPYTQFIVNIRRADGKLKRIANDDNALLYIYFDVGDRVRIHNSAYLKYTEKYDKSRDAQLFCAACNTSNDVRNSYCELCGAPMLKGVMVSPPEYTNFPPNMVRSSRTMQKPNDSGIKKFCTSCGAELSGGAFCENCGAAVNKR